DGLQSLTYLGKWLSITDNNNLVSLEGLNNLYLVHGIDQNLNAVVVRIENNNSLVNLEGLNSLRTVNGGFLIKENNNLESIEGVNSVARILYALEIELNPSLLSMSGFEGLEVAEEIRIHHNSQLETISGFNALLDARVFLTDNNNLQSI